MLEQVYETIRAIIYNDFPKNGNDQPVVYDRIVKQFYLGDQEAIGEQPAVVIRGSSSKPEKYGQGYNKVTHTITIQTWAQTEKKEIAERMSQEMARIIWEILLPHKRIWVCVKCPVCNKKIMSPLHFTDAHSTLFTPYVTTAETEMTNTWLETHPASDPVPPFVDSGIARAAYDLLDEDVRNNVSVPNLTNAAKNRILFYQNDKRRAVRLLYNVDVSNIKPSDDGMGKQILHSAEFTLTAEELIKQASYGPDSVPISAWD
jgi:hypothetical protein